MHPPVSVAEVDSTTLNKQRQQDKNLVLVDVREPWEYNFCVIEGAQFLPLSRIPEDLASFNVPKDARIVTYCHHGLRSQKAADSFVRAGWTNVMSLKGGIDQWSRRVDSSLRRY